MSYSAWTPWTKLFELRQSTPWDLVALLRIMRVLPYSLMLVNLFTVYRPNIVEIGWFLFIIIVSHNLFETGTTTILSCPRCPSCEPRNEPWWFRSYRGLYLPSYMGIIINHCKDPYLPSRIQWKVGGFFSWLNCISPFPRLCLPSWEFFRT